MPILDGSDFNPPWMFKNGHVNSMYPYFLSSTKDPKFERERIETPDNDFLDLDFIRSGNQRLVLLCHGLEGSSDSNYIKHYANHLDQQGYDVLAINYRGCSGEMNRQFLMYNSGKTDDLDWVIRHVLSDYDQIFLIGFSLGGNLILKYLGDGHFPISEKVKKAVAVSVPVHLSDASQQLLKPSNYLYQIKFLKTLRRKVRLKHRQFPDKIDPKYLLKTWNLYLFDEYFTAPMFGYKNAEDYYAQNQSIQFLDGIQTPTLIVNAKDDPFLGPKCFPYEHAERSSTIQLCVPNYGGHVGFVKGSQDRKWLDDHIIRFFTA